MKWHELSTATGNVLERCWFSTHSDRATKFSVKLGTKLYSDEDVVTLETLNEIFEYQKTNPHFNVTFTEAEQTINVCGAYEFYAWNDFDNSLTGLGKKTELEVGDFLYRTTSDDMAYFHREIVERITLKTITFRSGYSISTDVLNNMFLNENSYAVVEDSEFSQSFIFRESKQIVKAFKRQVLEEEFNNVFDLKTISDTKLRKIIEIIDSSEIVIVDDLKERKVLCKSCGESKYMRFVNTYGDSDVYYCTECEVQTQR